MGERLEQIQRAFIAYVVERELGSGGMATVYLAHDRKHDRRVAIKILHADLAAVLGTQRFLQEIRVTASLQHPHILGLIDSGVIGDDVSELRGRPYYVMPYVEGESLRQRLQKEQQLPVSDAVRIAVEVASALDYAHRRGVIHRDIKPENILLHDGSAIVADFGIALAITEAGGARMTLTGLSIGTPSYMSPEQAMGERTITARSDVYSLGGVTYEMLAGEPPFTGPTVQAIVAKVMSEEPRPLATQRRNVPPHVAAAVAQALEKIPADRFGSAHAFGEALTNHSFTFSSASAVRGKGGVRRERTMLYGAATLAALFLATTLWGWLRPEPSKQVVRYSLALDSAEAMVEGGSFGGRLAISPDGSRLAYIGGPRRQVLIRPRDQLHASAIPGTEGANTPFFSPDGAQVGFLRERSVQVVAAGGGPLTTITDSLTGVAGASWGRDGYIYVDGAGPANLLRVEAKSGAVPKGFTVLDTANGEVNHSWPDALPNGKGVLFTVTFGGKSAGTSGASYAIAVATIPSGEHRILVNDAAYARYAVSGHLLYVTTGGILKVAGFDQNSMQVMGEAISLTDGMSIRASGPADLAVSGSGTVVYTTGPGRGKEDLVWVSRDGRTQSVDPDWQGYFMSPAISPDGKRVAITGSLDGQTDGIWIKQLDRGPSIKLTLERSSNAFPTWTPDGQSVTFTSNAAGSYDLWTKRADGSAQAVLQLREKRRANVARWSPDGKWLIYQTGTMMPGSGDIVGIRPGPDTAPVPLVATRSIEVAPAISTDGQWLAYSSDESGQFEIYVVPFPNTRAAKWAISARGGTAPRWAHSGRELFYRDGDGNLVAVEIGANPTFSIGRTTTLFSAAEFRSDGWAPHYAVATDDRRFLMIRALGSKAHSKLIVVENLFQELNGKSTFINSR